MDALDTLKHPKWYLMQVLGTMALVTAPGVQFGLPSNLVTGEPGYLLDFAGCTRCLDTEDGSGELGSGLPIWG